VSEDKKMHDEKALALGIFEFRNLLIENGTEVCFYKLQFLALQKFNITRKTFDKAFILPTEFICGMKAFQERLLWVMLIIISQHS